MNLVETGSQLRFPLPRCVRLTIKKLTLTERGRPCNRKVKDFLSWGKMPLLWMHVVSGGSSFALGRWLCLPLCAHVFTWQSQYSKTLRAEVNVAGSDFYLLRVTPLKGSFVLPDHSCYLYLEAFSPLDNFCLKFQVSTQVLLAMTVAITDSRGHTLWPHPSIHLSQFSLP